MCFFMSIFSVLELTGRVETSAADVRATIDFPEPVALSEARDLFQRVANKTGLSIHYKVRGGCAWNLIGKVSRVKPRDLVEKSSFKGVKQSNEPFLYGVEFDTSRGREIENYAHGTVKLWDDFRNAVYEIFG